MEKSRSNVPQVQETNITLSVEPFLMPFAVIVSTIIFSIAMFASSVQLSKISIKAGSSGDPGNAVPTVLPSDTGDTAPTKATVSVDDDAVLGNVKKAKVGIVEFSDYQCPFCLRFNTDTFAQIKKDYIDTGKAVFVYRDLPLSFHPFAQKEAEAAECAGEQGKYFEMHDYIFNNKGELSVDKLKEGAVQIGLDSGKFNTCIDTSAMAAEISKDSQDASNAGINGTPGFVIGPIDKDGNVNGQIISGAMPYDTFKQAIDASL